MGRLSKLLGGEDVVATETARPDGSGGESSPDLAALAAQARKSGRRSTKAQRQVAEAAQSAEVDALFQDENWEEIAALYFNARYAMTGWDGFKLSEKQQRVLGSSMGTCMKLLLAIDPRYVALIVFSINFGAFVTDKELRFKQVVDEAKRRRQQQQGVTHGGEGTAR